MEPFLFLYIIRFSLQLFFCEGLFAVHYKRRNHFVGRAIIGMGLYFLSGYGVFRVIVYAGSGRPLVISLCFLMMFLLSVLTVSWVFDVQFEEALFIGIGGYAIQHVAYISQIIVEYTWLTELSPLLENLLLKILPYLIIGLPIYYLVIKPNMKSGEQKNKDIKMIFLGVIIIIAVIFLSIYVGTDNNQFNFGVQVIKPSWVVARLYGVLSCILVLFIQFNLTIQNKLQHDNDILEHLIYIENQQQEMNKETIDLINFKYHDLKHQFRQIIDMNDKEEQRQHYNAMAKELMTYDRMMKTGNGALDVILTEKSLLCGKHNIQFSCMVDGSRLSFMEVPDIYALFGNALDNAIENVTKINDISKRIISMRMNRRADMLYVHIENYCEYPPKFKDGLPVTSKKNRDIHGFGVRSIQYIVNKYKGDVSMKYESNHYYLDMLFPG